jgi:hypothetical protein
MHYCPDEEYLFLQGVQDGKRKTSDKAAPDWFRDYSEALWVGNNQGDASFNFYPQVSPQVGAQLSEIGEGLEVLVFSVRMELLLQSRKSGASFC